MYYLHNVNEPIVSTEIFDMAKALLEKRQKKFTHTTYGDAGIFTRMIYCKKLRYTIQAQRWRSLDMQNSRCKYRKVQRPACNRRAYQKGIHPYVQQTESKLQTHSHPLYQSDWSNEKQSVWKGCHSSLFFPPFYND